MARYRVWVWAIVLSAAAWGTSDAQAYGPWAWGFGGIGAYGPFSADYRQPPYFAVHPPVYYSHQINRRPYGASPFPWVDGPGVAIGGAGLAPVAISQTPYQPSPPAPGILVVNPYATPGRAAPAAPATEESLPAPTPKTPAPKKTTTTGATPSSEASPEGELIVNPFVGKSDRVAERP